MPARWLFSLILLGLFQLIRISRSSRLREISVRLVSRAAFHLAGRKRAESERAVRRCLPGGPEESCIRPIVLGSFETLWADVLGCVATRGDQETLRKIRVEGFEQIRSGLAEGRGIILWESNSFGRRNLAKQVLNCRGQPVCQVHAAGHFLGIPGIIPRSARMRGFMKRFFDRQELTFVQEIVTIDEESFGYLRGLLARLRTNQIICSAGDGRMGKSLIETKFLGIRTGFSSGMIRLAELSGAPILPLFCYRSENGEPVVRIEEALDLSCESRSDRARRGVSQFAASLEAKALEHPEQFVAWSRFGSESRRVCPTDGESHG